MKAFLKYPGSKWRIAKEIIKLIPEHHSYLEPFFGSGAVFFNKKPSKIETINDIDSNVTNLFKCMREDPRRLAAKVALTPYSRDEYVNAYEDKADTYDQAVNFLIKCCQGRGFRTTGEKVGWKRDIQGREAMYAVRSWVQLPQMIEAAAERLRQVQIDNSPAIEIIRRFNCQNVFMYVDPPYIRSTRLHKKAQYKYEMTDQDHTELLEELLKSKAKIIISGYQSELYDEFLKKWKKIETNSNDQTGRRITEILWMNY